MKSKGKGKKKVWVGYSWLPAKDMLSEYPDGYLMLFTTTTKREGARQNKIRITVQEL